MRYHRLRRPLPVSIALIGVAGTIPALGARPLLGCEEVMSLVKSGFRKEAMRA